MIAASWLLTQGYEVFRNTSFHGPVDLIALDTDTGKTHLFDVKTIQPYVNKDGTEKFGYGKLTREQELLGVRGLLVNLDTHRCFFLEDTLVAEDVFRLKQELN